MSEREKSFSFRGDPLHNDKKNVGNSHEEEAAASFPQCSTNLASSQCSMELSQPYERFEDEYEKSETSTASQRWRRLSEIFRSQSSVRDILKRITASDRQKILTHQGLSDAAFLIRDAVLGRVENPEAGAYDPYIKPERVFRNAVSVVCRRICSSRPVVQTLRGAAWILLLLTFFEPPMWCSYGRYSYDLQLDGCEAIFSAKGIPASNAAEDDATEEEVVYYPNSNSMLITQRGAVLVEMLCVGIIFFIVLLRFGRDGLSVPAYLSAGPCQTTRIIQLVCLLGISVGVFRDYRMLNPFFRLTLLTSFLPGVQRDLIILMEMLPQVFNVLVLLGVFMTFYAWFGCVMFVGTEEGRLHFPSLIEALWTLWICVTTSNYPDVMMPSYNSNSWTALYFVSFMIVSFFFLMNIILASVVNSHDAAMQKQKAEQAELSSNNLKKAFKFLDSNGLGLIDRETVMGLFWILNEDFPEIRTLSSDDTKLLFALLDKDGNNQISEEEFMDFGNILLLEFTNMNEYSTFVETHFPVFFATEGFQSFCRIIKSESFEIAIDVILVLNAIVVGIQSYPELSGGSVDVDAKYLDGAIDTVWELIETIFTGIYVVEVIIKVLVIGWRRYIESTKNLFDFTITALAVASSVVVYLSDLFQDTRLVRMVVMLRVMRLLRLVLAIKRFQLLGAISADILPASRSVATMLFLLMYLFASIGVHFFGGLITRDPNNELAYLVLGTDFSDNEYWANNFNDMFSAMNVLFNLLVVNNWTNCEIGFEATTQSKWVRVFFLSYHIFGVILISNLVIAFVIDKFLSSLKFIRERTEKQDRDGLFYHREAVFSGSEITGTKTSLTGNYIARFESPDKDGDDQERLRKLFTPNNPAAISGKGPEQSRVSPG